MGTRSWLRIFFSSAFVGLLTLGFLITPVWADSDNDYQVFLTRYRQYQNLLGPFNIAQSRYRTYQSVVSQAELLQAAKELLQAESAALLAYADFVRAYLAEATLILNYQENYLYVKLDDARSRAVVFAQQLESLSTLEETHRAFVDLESQYRNISALTYQVKAVIEISAVGKIYQNIVIEKSKVDSLIEQKSAEPAAKATSARERFATLEKNLNDLAGSISRLYDLQKQFTGGDAQSVARSIRSQVDRIVLDFDQLVLGYQNIVYALKR